MTAVSAIVVHRDGRELLRACLESLRPALARVGGGAELIVVDNASSDGSRELVRERFPDVRLLTLDRNAGFAGGVSAGLRAAGGDWILTLNDDATVEPGAVRALLEAAESVPQVWSVASQMRFAADPDVINSAGIGVDSLGVAFDRLVGRSSAASEARPVEVFGASAGAALYRRSMLVELSGFDESFHIYLEDVDLAWRARMRGWRSLYAPGALVYHHHSATSGHSSSAKHYYVGRNRVRLLAKNLDGRHLRRWLVPIVAYEVAYTTYATVADGTLAPLRGRLVGLRDWRRLRRAFAEGRRPVALEPPQGLRAALGRRTAFKRWSLRAP